MGNRASKVGKNYKTRVPVVESRDPKPAKVAKAKRESRHYIEASMPTVCPDCGHTTRMADGRHIDPVKCTILEYRTCSKCEKRLAAGRKMTKREVERFCSHADAVAEYQGER